MSNWLESHCISPDWPAPNNVKALMTKRTGGISTPPYDSLNCAFHVDDNPIIVEQNIARLTQHASMPTAPLWMNQVHGTEVHDASILQPAQEGDAMFAHQPNTVCAILTADCLPVLFCSKDGNAVAAAHAGWRGLAAGVLEDTLASMRLPPKSTIAWLGAAIGPKHFEVGEEVLNAFTSFDTEAQKAFIQTSDRTWLANIYLLAQQRLQRAGVAQIYGLTDACTFAQPDDFFSYRRASVTGRMASIIWFE